MLLLALAMSLALVAPVSAQIQSFGGLSLDSAGNLKVNVVAGGGSGGTSSTFGAAFPGTGTAAGFIDNGGNMAGANLDASGFLKVNCLAGCSAAGSFTDNTAFTAGTTTITNVGGVFNDGLAAVTSGNAAAPRITAQRGLHANLRNNAGTEVGTSGAPLRIDPTGSTTQPVSGTVTANQGGAPWSQRLQDGIGATLATVTAGNALKVDGSAVTQPVSGTVTTTPPSNASTNVAQFGGVNVSTGTGASGTGIPRVTVANDSNILATQSGTWTVQPGNTANTTPWLASINQGGNTATVSAGGALKVDGSAATQPVSGTVSATQGTSPWVTSLASTTLTATVAPAGLTAIATGQQAVTASAVALPSSAGKIVCVKVKDGGTQTVYFGPSGVAVGTGQEIVPGEGVCRPGDNANRIFVIAGGTGSTVAWEVWGP
jgi:hypothetical protein